MCPIQSVNFIVYKPYGFLSQMTSNNHKEAKSKRFLSELYEFPEEIMAVGRLDEKSEGLLFLTSDGKLSDSINRSGIEKEYYAQLDGEITAVAIQQLETGVEIGLKGAKYRTRAVVKKLESASTLPTADSKIRLGGHRPNSWISIILTEGKFRQVRKMTASVGFPTLRLVRVRIGSVTFSGLEPGMVKKVDELNFM